MRDKKIHLGSDYLKTEGVSVTTATTDDADDGADPSTHEERNLGEER